MSSYEACIYAPCEVCTILINVAGFTKTISNGKLKPNINDILIHCPEVSAMYMAIDSQVCFHRWLFADPVKLHQCITGPLESLGSTNQNWCGDKLLPTFVSTYPVDCVHLCEHRATVCALIAGEPAFGLPTHPHHPDIHQPPRTYDTRDITGVTKNYLKDQQ